MREIEYCRKHLDPGDTYNDEILYYITVDEVLSNGEIRFENYGVGIRLNNGEEEQIRGITIDAKKIELILDILSNGTVTPICLRDVLYDLLEIII